MGYPGSSSIRYLVKITDLKTIIFIAIVKENKNKRAPDTRTNCTVTWWNA
jgi:hypothetical protein